MGGCCSTRDHPEIYDYPKLERVLAKEQVIVQTKDIDKKAYDSILNSIKLTVQKAKG